MFNPETIAEMSNWNTLLIFCCLIGFCAFVIGIYICTIIEGIVMLVKFIRRKIKEKKKGASSDEDTHTKH